MPIAMRAAVMTSAPASEAQHRASLYRDNIGERLVTPDLSTGELLQVLQIEPSLTRVPSFEFALRERRARLANFDHPSYARVRKVDRHSRSGGLVVVSDHVVGSRLSDLLRIARERRLEIDISTALCILRQLVPAVALLHDHARNTPHGLISPERIVITPQARVVVVEHVLAGAMEQLRYGVEQLWREFRIAVCPGEAPARFDPRGDVLSVGLVALALVVGRPLEEREFPGEVVALVDRARERTALGYERPLSTPLRDWLLRALQLEARSFTSARDASSSLEEIVSVASLYVTSPITLEMFLSRCAAAVMEPEPAYLDVRPERSHGGVSAPRVHPAAAIQPITFRALAPNAEEIASAPSEPPFAAAAEELASFDAPVHQPSEWIPRDPPASPEALASEIRALLSDPPLAPVEQPDMEWPGGSAETPFELPELPQARWRARLAACHSLVIRRRTAAAALTIGVLGGGAFATHFVRTGAVAAPIAGTIAVESVPSALQVFIDGIERGRTPVRLSVEPGERKVEVRGRGEPRAATLVVAAGAEVLQHFRFETTPAAAALHPESNPAEPGVPAARTGGTPAATAAPRGTGETSQKPASFTRPATAATPESSKAVAAPAPAASPSQQPSWGWLVIQSPFPVEPRVGNRAVGTFGDERIRLASGRHQLQLVNTALGYRSSHSVQIVAGRTTSLKAEAAQGTVNINASPWAEVWLGNRRIGETPLGNVLLPIGRHELVFRHPELGEKRKLVAVTAAATVRVGVDMK